MGSEHAILATAVPGKHNDSLGLGSLTGLVIASMIGAGVFTTSGFALSELGSADSVMLAWIIGGALALSGAASYGGLVHRISDSGGEYLFLSKLVHPVAGFVGGWVSLLAGFTGAIAFAALALEAYAAPLRPLGLPEGTVATGAILLAGGLHGVRVRTGVLTQNTAVIVKMGLIVAFLLAAGFIAVTRGTSPAPAPAQPVSIAALASTLVWISLSYSGFNAAVYVAGEARNARVAAPRALWLGTMAVTAIYLGMNAAFLYLPPYDAVAGRQDIAAAAALSIGGELAAALVRAVIALALLTSVFSMVMSGPRVYARMADDGLFPRMFSFTAGPPRAAIALQSGLAIVVVNLTELRTLLSYLGFTLSISAALTVASLFLLHRREGRAAIRVPGYPVTPAFYVIGTLVLAGIAGSNNPAELAAALCTMLAGSLIYLALERYRS